MKQLCDYVSEAASNVWLVYIINLVISYLNSIRVSLTIYIYIYSVHLHVYSLLLAMVIAVHVLTFTSDIKSKPFQTRKLKFNCNDVITMAVKSLIFTPIQILSNGADKLTESHEGHLFLQLSQQGIYFF